MKPEEVWDKIFEEAKQSGVDVPGKANGMMYNFLNFLNQKKIIILYPDSYQCPECGVSQYLDYSRIKIEEGM